eukprot:superscaffoldBa00004641_g19223
MSLVDRCLCGVPPLRPPASSARSVRIRVSFSGGEHLDHLAILQANISSNLRGSRHPPRASYVPPRQAVVHGRSLHRTDASVPTVALSQFLGYSPVLTPLLPPSPAAQQQNLNISLL